MQRTLAENARNLANCRATPDAKSTKQPPACYNHPDKQATHLLPQTHQHQPIHYCQKCSIMLASKGHNIVKLVPASAASRQALRSPVRSPRQQEIEQFLAELSWHLEELRRKHVESQDVLRESEAHFGTLLQEVTAFFKEIEDVLEVQKYLSYNAILNQRASAQAELRLAREAMQQQAEELAAIGNDIQNNMEAVQQVEPPIYHSIMENYRFKAAAAFELHSLQLAPLPRPAIALPEIPKMLYSLADKLTLRTDSPRETLTLPAAPRQSVPARTAARAQSCENSRRDGFSPNPQPKKSLANWANLKNAESVEDKEIAFSFESNEAEEERLQKALFGRRDGFLPQEMVFRESLSLTEIRENDEDEPQPRRCFEETIPIPEEMVASQESIGGYFAANTLNYSPREGNERVEDTETLLIC